MRVSFDDLFAVQNGMVTPKVPINMNGITMGSGVSFGNGVSFAGVDLTKLIGKFLEIEIQNGVRIIKGFYNY